MLGTVGYHPTETRHTSCAMLPADGIVLDAGTGFFRVRELLETKTLDILLTHSHLDHVCGLTYLIDVAYQKGLERITVHGRPEDLETVKSKLFSSPLFPVEFSYQLKPIAPYFEINGWQIRTREQIHPGGSIGFRFDRAKESFAFITDTSADPSNSEMIEFIRDVKLLIHECNFSDEFTDLAKSTGHSSATHVAKVAKQAKVHRLLLTHLQPLSTQPELNAMLRTVQQVFTPSELAFDLQSLALS